MEQTGIWPWSLIKYKLKGFYFTKSEGVDISASLISWSQTLNERLTPWLFPLCVVGFCCAPQKWLWVLWLIWQSLNSSKWQTSAMDRHILFRAEIQGHCRQRTGKLETQPICCALFGFLYFLPTSLFNTSSLKSTNEFLMCAEKTFKNVTVLFCAATHVHLARDIGQCMRVVQVINHISSRS